MAYRGTNHKGGRPKGTVGTNTKISQLMREALLNKVSTELDPILQGQIDLAKGIVVRKRLKLKDGKVVDRYYLSKPDSSAAKYLLDQAIGRAKESLEVSGEMTLIELVNSLEHEKD